MLDIVLNPFVAKIVSSADQNRLVAVRINGTSLKIQ